MKRILFALLIVASIALCGCRKGCTGNCPPVPEQEEEHNNKRPPLGERDISTVPLSAYFAICSIGNSSSFVITSSTNCYIESVYTGDKFEETEDMLLMGRCEYKKEQQIDSQENVPLPYQLHGEGYTITQSDSRTFEVSVDVGMPYLRLLIWISAYDKERYDVNADLNILWNNDPYLDRIREYCWAEITE